MREGASSETRLNEVQLGQVVAELSRLAQERQDQQARGLDRDQVNQVLKELDLPIDLLDTAMEQLRKREEIARQRRKRILLSISAIGLVIVIIASIFLFSAHRSAIYSHVSADQGRITRAADDGGDMGKVMRDGQDVVYHVVLRDVPLNETLSLSCRWLDPAGKIFHENHWQTKTTDKSTWPTFARCRLGSAAPSGQWTVEISFDGRILSTTTFQVE